MSVSRIEKTSLNFVLSSNLPLAPEIRWNNDEATFHDSAGTKLLQNHAGLYRLAEADLIAEQEAMRVTRNDTMHHAHLVRFDVDPGVPERHEVVVEVRETVVTRHQSKPELLVRDDLTVPELRYGVKILVRA